VVIIRTVRHSAAFNSTLASGEAVMDARPLAPLILRIGTQTS